MALSFSGNVSVCGTGTEVIGDEAEDFVMEGEIRDRSRWELTKTFASGHRVLYKVPQHSS